MKVWALLLFYFCTLLPSAALAAVAADTDSSSNCTGCSSLSWSHTVGASATLLVCSVVNVNVASPTAFTFNAVALTKHTGLDAITGGQLDLWYLINPTVGAHTVAITESASADALAGGCTSFTGSTGAPGSATTLVGTSPSAIVDGVSITVPANGMAFGAGLYSYAACTNEAPDTGNTERYDTCADAGGNNAGAFAVTRTTSGQIVWTNRPSGAAEAVIAVQINPVTAPTGKPRRMLVTVQ